MLKTITLAGMLALDALTPVNHTTFNNMIMEALMDMNKLDSYHILDVVNDLNYRRRIYLTMTAFKQYAKQYEVDTPARVAMFWSQMAHETGGFKWYKELGGPSYFAKYDGRRDLGNNKPGDGYRFKGRGIIHLTGRANYTEYSKKLGIDLVATPELAETPEVAVQVALAYWKDRGLNRHADTGNVRRTTKIINGGYNGLADRTEYFTRFKKTLEKDFIVKFDG